MRLDKFFKVSRIIKRRPIAKKVLDNKNVKLNGKTAKASSVICVDDIIELNYFNKYFKLKVLIVPTENVKKEESEYLFKMIEVKENVL